MYSGPIQPSGVELLTLRLSAGPSVAKAATRVRYKSGPQKYDSYDASTSTFVKTAPTIVTKQNSQPVDIPRNGNQTSDLHDPDSISALPPRMRKPSYSVCSYPDIVVSSVSSDEDRTSEKSLPGSAKVFAGGIFQYIFFTGYLFIFFAGGCFSLGNFPVLP